MKNNSFFSALCGAAVGLLTGCQSAITGPETSNSQGPVSPSPSAVAISASNLDLVTDTEWQLVSMVVAGQETGLADGSSVTLSISTEGRVSGAASVNRYNGGFSISDEGAVQWGGAFATTRMAGPPALMNQEQKYLAALEQTTSMALQNAMLRLSSSDQTSVLIYSPKKDD